MRTRLNLCYSYCDELPEAVKVVKFTCQVKDANFDGCSVSATSVRLRGLSLKLVSDEYKISDDRRADGPRKFYKKKRHEYLKFSCDELAAKKVDLPFQSRLCSKLI